MDSVFLTDEEINAYVQYEAGNKEYFKLTEEKYAEIGQKIRSSDLHRRRYEQSKQVYDEILGIKEKSKFPFLAIAASLLILLICSGVYYFGSLNNQLDTLTYDGKNLPTLAELNKRYGLNETLENRVNYPLRGLSIQDILPENSSIFKGEVKFSWEVENSEELILKIYDKSEKVLFKKATVDGTVEWKIPESNIYYWSLEDDSEVFHWGKVYGIKD
ncbi:MAG: hypothetical protein WBA74_15615 [Cyclobacteriaceae bacterium]